MLRIKLQGPRTPARISESPLQGSPLGSKAVSGCDTDVEVKELDHLFDFGQAGHALWPRSSRLYIGANSACIPELPQ